MKNRLALFLDGTWNTEDDSTNVYHAYSLTLEGLVEGGTVMQRRYYDPGVGTGMLDSVTGGGFGLGLDKNVRQAYNWLVDHYQDGDEIYIFGFSRGAFTARSLMGFLAACGLIRRGAPMNISQLWDGYVFNSQNRDKKESEPKFQGWWEKTLKKPAYRHRFRRIGDVRDNVVFNDSEEILLKWSRRVDITYMGIFDTVGAMGWQALGVPGITSKLDQHHNPYPSGILKKCRHALAIDENRTSFRLSRLEHFIKNDDDQSKAERYDDDIRQRWFVGAHSNIGGGYPNNLLAARPLEWMLEGACAEGLVVKKSLKKEKTMEGLEQLNRRARLTDLVDSYADFAKPMWEHIIRAKRHYRPIMRPDLLQEGQALHSINEEVDESVIDFIKTDGNEGYAPANLTHFVHHHCDDEELKEAYDRNWESRVPAEHSIFFQIILVLWCVMVALGTEGFLYFFFANAPAVGITTVMGIAAFYVCVNWAESWANLALTLRPNAIVPKVGWNIMLWFRLLGILGFVIGAIVFVKKAGAMGWGGGSLDTNWLAAKEVFLRWWPVPVAASAVTLLLYLVKTTDQMANRFKTIIGVAILPTAALAAIGGGIIGLSSVLHFLMSGPEGTSYGQAPGDFINFETEYAAGITMFILLLWLIFFGGVKWVGMPMGPSRANLGSITQLQWKFTPKAINSLFEKWEESLSRQRDGKDGLGNIDYQQCKEEAWSRVKAILEEAIWRDFFGFIPIYALVLGLTIWLGAETGVFGDWGGLVEQPVLGGMPAWLVLLAVVVIADLVENTVHLHHLKKYRDGGISLFHSMLGGVANLVKTAGFIVGFVLALVVSCQLIITVLTHNDGGWRWILATAILYFNIITVGPAFLKVVIVPRILELLPGK